MAEQLVLLFNPAKHKKVNKHFKIRRQFQNSTACPNDMIQALVLNHFLFFKERYCPDPEEPHPNGGKFEGEFKDDKRNGQGRIIW